MCARPGSEIVRWSVRRSFGARTAGVALALALAPAGGARADAPDPPAAQAAASRVRDGDRARLEGRFAEAEASYRAALALAPDDATSLRLGLCLSAQGKVRAAAETFARLLGPGSALPEADRPCAARALADARKALATVEVRASVDGASIEVDGAKVGAAPLPRVLYLEPGPHAFHASRSGFLGAQAAVDTSAGHGYVVELDLQRDPIEIARTAPAESPPAPSPGDYFFGLGGRLRGAGIGLGVTLLVGGGAALGIAGENRDLVAAYARVTRDRGTPSCLDTKPKQDRDCARLEQSIDAASIATTAAGVLFAGAGAIAAATFLTVVLLPPSGQPGAARSTLTLTPTAGIRGGGLSLEASW